MNKYTQRFINTPGQMGKGSGYLAQQWKCTQSEVIDARREARRILAGHEKAETANYIVELETQLTERITDNKTGNETLTFQSSKPLSPKEIQELAQVDNLTSFVDRTWLKSHKNGTWTYSINTTCKVKDFYSSTELTEKLASIFSETTPVFLPVIPNTSKDKTLFLYIADDHCGLILKDSLFGKEYSGSIYAKRLLTIIDELKELGQTFEEICIVRMGDEMDGYNAKTTRYDHPLDSASNKEQFDIYTTSNKLFYDTVFQSGIANGYTVWNLNNSNHSGAGFSYMANKALEFWIEARYPEVVFRQQQHYIDHIVVGNHVIGLTHGKDEKYMKSNMPLNLDYKTDLYLMDYFKPYVNSGNYIHLIKGDLHKYNVNQGKFGRYVNVPSISSGSNWIEHNFGDSKPGALVEIYKDDSENVISFPIWFKD